MDAERFDGLVKTFSTPDTRRGTLRLLLGAVLGGLLTRDPLLAVAKKQHGKDQKQNGTDANRQRRTATAERCLAVGEKCPKTLKHGRKQVKHSCAKGCCTGYAAVSSDGKRRCACKSNGSPCSPETARQCCSQVCTGGVCGSAGARGCTPTTCAAQGKNCGAIPDGCGNQIRCGPDSCGDGYNCTDNRCLCPNGTAVCEGVCCAAGQTCQDGDGPCCTREDPCGPTSCGTIIDNCGVAVDCGDSRCSGSTPVCVTNICTACSAANLCPGGLCCDAVSGQCVATCPTPGFCGGGGTAGVCGTPPQGTCPDGGDYCLTRDSGLRNCNNSVPPCFCRQTIEGATVCAKPTVITCTTCTSSTACGAGQVCVVDTGEFCSCLSAPSYCWTAC